ncbi:MAG: alpha/beta hydrolase [Chloroflexi bacterium]|nr:alpha/beta hydrolase [Chloroflexota bacterium]
MDVNYIITDELNIAYEEHGDEDGFPVILLHGFPYDVRSWDGVIPYLLDAGKRVLVPYLRGYGPTSFRSPDIPRKAQQAAIAQDVVDFAERLEINEFSLSGFDWGNRAACIVSIFHPDLVRSFVSIGGYAVQDTINREIPASAEAEAKLWYQWYFNTEQGRAGLELNRRDIIRYLWETWSPGWKYSDEAFDASAPSFDNPDFVEITLHSYRHRHMNAIGEDRFIEIEQELAKEPVIEVPSIVLRGGESGLWTPSKGTGKDKEKFGQLIDWRIVEGAGHDAPVQRPEEVSLAILELI